MTNAVDDFSCGPAIQFRTAKVTASSAASEEAVAQLNQSGILIGGRRQRRNKFSRREHERAPTNRLKPLARYFNDRNGTARTVEEAMVGNQAGVPACVPQVLAERRLAGR